MFSHGDYHTANVLFDGAVVGGVVDWSGARLGPRGADVAQCRCELSIWPGGDLPDVFLSNYQAVAGVQLSAQPLWDVLAAARALQWHELWVPVYGDLGVPLTAESVRTSVLRFMEQALLAADRP